MDEDTLALILSRMDENHQDLKEVKESISEIKSGIVGQVHCDAYRRDFTAKLSEHTEQIRELKTVCDGYQATKTILISETALRDAKDDAIKQSGNRYDSLEPRVAELERYVKLVGFVWGNPAVKTLLVGSLLTMIGVYWGRIGQYGWHVVGGFLVAVAIVLAMSWISRRKNREVTKTTTKKLFGLKFLLVFLAVISIATAQDNISCEQHPVVFGVDKIPHVIEYWGGWLDIFMSNDTFPTPIGNNSSQLMTA
jgi:hypothetical protein